MTKCFFCFQVTSDTSEVIPAKHSINSLGGLVGSLDVAAGACKMSCVRVHGNNTTIRCISQLVEQQRQIQPIKYLNPIVLPRLKRFNRRF